jgi:hypothetical protein
VSAYGLGRDPGGANTTITRKLPKQIQTKPSRNPWFSLVLFVRIGTFQRCYGQKNKKNRLASRVVCETSHTGSPERFSRRAAAAGGATSESVLNDSNGLRRHFRVAQRPPRLPLVLKNSNTRPPARQEKVDCLAGRPVPRPARLRRRREPPKRSIHRIPNAPWITVRGQEALLSRHRFPTRTSQESEWRALGRTGAPAMSWTKA